MPWVTTATDAFTRANETPLAGSGWSDVHNFNLNTNRVVVPDSSQDSYSMYVNIAFANDQFSRASISDGSGGATGAGPGVIVRKAAAGIVSYYRLVGTDKAGTNIELLRFNTGSFLTLVQYAVTFVAGQTIELRVTGQGTSTVLESLYNGVSLGTYNDTSGSALNSGSPGIGYSSDIGSSIIDDWSGGEFQASAAPIIAPGRISQIGYLG